MQRNYNIYATYHCQGGGMGASGYAPSTPSNGMAWQLLLLVPNLLTKDPVSLLVDPVHNAGITGSFFGPKPKELRKHTDGSLLSALQVTVVYKPLKYSQQPLGLLQN